MTPKQERASLDPQRWNLYAYCMNNPVAFRDPDGMDAISVQEGLRIVSIAQAAIGTPYESPGQTLGEKGGADCSGSTWAILNAAGFEYSHTSTHDFPGKANKDRFIEIKDDAKLQEGDIGVWKWHMVIYGGKKDGMDIVYSAHSKGKLYQEDTLSEWVTWKKGESPTWYRYNKEDGEARKTSGQQ